MLSVFFFLRTNNIMPVMVRKVGENISLLVCNKKVGCNKKEVMDLMGKFFASVAQKDKIILIHRFIFFLTDYYQFC